MGIIKNLGGNRLGSGNKNNIELHGYNRSTHDLSRAWRSSMNVGTLVPFMVEPILTGDTWTIDLESIIRTIPAVGPLYGSYKLQLDVFCAPIRLYNGLLHNNMTKIGMNMAQVKLPKITLEHMMNNPFKYTYNVEESQISTSSLINYLGVSGLCDANWRILSRPDKLLLRRKFNAVPILAYWDIYKNYYANKQEESGVMIVADPQPQNTAVTEIRELSNLSNSVILTEKFKPADESTPPTGVTPDFTAYQELTPMELTDKEYELQVPESFATEECKLLLYNVPASTYSQVAIKTVFPLITNELDENNYIKLGAPASTYVLTQFKLAGITYNPTAIYQSAIRLERFDLQNIDQMRIDILQATGLGNELDLSTINYSPYKELSQTDGNTQTLNKYNQHGLGIKTYQSDLFNNWIQDEWITGINGIAAVTAVDTSGGSFTIDALNLAQKVYNMLNRIAVSGGSYEDYLEAVYGIEVSRRAESPIYMGGMSAEIVFEEVVATAATTDNPLGTLAGKGTQAAKKGGKMDFRLEEPSFLMGIISITPRVDYSQGNKWFMTELDTLDDLHKPELDGIGFQDLMQEQMAWWGTIWDSVNKEFIRGIAGKVPAWINYMTAVNETHGDFAESKKTMYMTLNRRYEYNYNEIGIGGIKDLTTYINPTKFNYTFADHNLNAQNFWVQVGIKLEPRRLMSAKLIPNM